MEDTKVLNSRLSKIKRDSIIKDECFYHKKDECSDEIIKSHSISKSGRLDLIKDSVKGNQMVYSLKEVVINEGQSKVGIKPIGWSEEASTFHGFCNFHDDTLFKPIEDGNNFDEKNNQHLFLHSYRSFAYSYHKVKELYKLVNNEDNFKELKKIPDALSQVNNLLSSLKIDPNKIPLNQEIPKGIVDGLKVSLLDKISKTQNNENVEKVKQQLLRGIENIRTIKDLLEFIPRMGQIIGEQETKLKYLLEKRALLKKPEYQYFLNFMNEYKQQLDYMIEYKKYDLLEYSCVVTDTLFPFACAFAFSPDYLYSGMNNFVILPKEPNKLLNSCLMVTILPDESNKTIILFSCFKEDEQAKFYLKKLFSLRDKDVVNFEKAVTSVIINKSSNMFLSPMMWERLGEVRQRILEEEINIKRRFDELPERPFMSQINFFDKEFSMENLQKKS